MPQHPAEIANTMISDRFEVYHVKDQVNENITRYHYHDFYEIHCTLQGTGTFFIDGREHQLRPGSIVFISDNDLHRIVNQTSTFFERVYIFVAPQYLKTFSTPQTDLAIGFHLLGKKQSHILTMEPNLLAELLAPLDQQPPQEYGADFLYEEKFLHFLLTINRLALQGEKIIETRPLKQDDFISNVINYLNDHLAEDLALETVAAHFFTDKYYLSREFKKQMGLTFHTFVMKKRLLYSKQLLRRYRNANEVYQLCGFHSYTHFLRRFKQEFQLTPKEFLQKEDAQQFVQFDHYEHQQP